MTNVNVKIAVKRWTRLGGEFVVNVVCFLFVRGAFTMCTTFVYRSDEMGTMTTTVDENPHENIDFWDCDEGAEHLRHTAMDEAIESHLDGLWDDMTADAFLDVMPDELKVYGFVHEALGDISCLNVLDNALERLDEEHGDPEGRVTTDSNEAMKKAEATFLSVLQDEYEVWACQHIITETVDPKAWVREHCPHWLHGMGLKAGDRVYDRSSDMFGKIAAILRILPTNGTEVNDKGAVAKVKYEWPYDPKAEPREVPLHKLVHDHEAPKGE